MPKIIGQSGEDNSYMNAIAYGISVLIIVSGALFAAQDLSLAPILDVLP